MFCSATIEPMINAEEYLRTQLQDCSKYELSGQDKEFLDKEGIEAFIVKTVTSKKFRKWALPEEAKERVKKAVFLCVAQKKPIQFTFPFGGYKLWRLPTAPEVDWAEFFTISYYVDYLSPIISVYEPGVLFSFSSDEVIVEELDNVPQQDTDLYHRSFTVLLQQFSQFFPGNLKIELVKVRDRYTSEAYSKELRDNIEKMREIYRTMNYQKREKLERTSALNIMWKGAIDLTSMSENEKQEKISFGPILHDAYCALSKRRAFVRGDEKIVIFPVTIPNAVAIGCTKTSVTKFWTGLGVLENTDNFLPRIVSPQQWEFAKNAEYSVQMSRLIPLKNFREIIIYPSAFSFSRKESFQKN